MPYKDVAKYRAYQAEYQVTHREEIRAQRAAYRATHPTPYDELHKATQKRSYTKHRALRCAHAKDYYTANREACLKRDRAYKEAHRAEINQKRRTRYAAHREKEIATVLAYRQTERGAYLHRESQKRRKHLKRQAASCTKPLTLEQWERVVSLADGCCYWNWCGEKMLKPTQDHIIPLGKGGLHTASNVVAACGSCNSKKGVKVLTLF